MDANCVCVCVTEVGAGQGYRLVTSTRPFVLYDDHITKCACVTNPIPFRENEPEKYGKSRKYTSKDKNSRDWPWGSILEGIVVSEPNPSTCKGSGSETIIVPRPSPKPWKRVW